MIVFSENSENLQFVLDQKLSDHKPIMAEGFLSWNMLCMCRVVNNGFQMDETLQEGAAYKERLKKVAALINRWVEEAALVGHPIEVICLQEAPYLPEYLTLFLDALHWETFNRESIVLTQAGSHKFQNLTLYSKHYLGNVITDLLPVHHDCQKNRYHIVELMNKKTGIKHKIGNVHFEWFPKKKMILREVTREIVKTLLLDYRCSLMGDFNQSLHWMLEDPQIQNTVKAFYYPEGNNISFSANRMEDVHYGQIDALILS